MTKRLSLGEKLGYGVADVGASLTFVAVNTWLLYFLVNVVKLEPLRAGVVFVMGRALDALLDPVMGVLSDRLKGRVKRTQFIRWGALPLGLSFALLWFVPDGSQSLKFAFALLMFMLFSVLYTVVQVPYMALTPDIAPDYDERTRLTSFRMGFRHRRFDARVRRAAVRGAGLQPRRPRPERAAGLAGDGRTVRGGGERGLFGNGSIGQRTRP